MKLREAAGIELDLTLFRQVLVGAEGGELGGDRKRSELQTL